MKHHGQSTAAAAGHKQQHSDHHARDEDAQPHAAAEPAADAEAAAHTSEPSEHPQARSTGTSSRRSGLAAAPPPSSSRSQVPSARREWSVVALAAVASGIAVWLTLKLRGGRLRRPADDRRSSSGSGAARSRQLAARAQRQQQLQQQQAEAEVPEPASTLAVLASDFQLPTQDVPLVARPAALEGLTCVVSEHIPIQGATIGCGVPALWSQQPVASAHASVNQKLLNKGFSIAGQGSTQPFNYPTLGTNLRNPAARFRVCGGGASGAVAAVAQQQAHVAVGSDFLGSVRIPAACQGVFALLCTPGVYQPNSQQVLAAAGAAGQGSADRGSDGGGSSSSRGTSSSSRRGASGGLESAAFAVADLSVLRRVAEHLALAGVSDLRGDLTQVVVAEDLFSLCEPEMEQGLLCMKRAVLQWAGQEQAGSVQLLPFLESNCKSWSNLAAAADASPLAAVTTGSGAPLPPVLRAITYAAQLLYHHELATRYGDAAAAAATAAASASGAAAAAAEPADTAAAAGAAAGDSDQQQQLQQQQGQEQQQEEVLEPAIAAAIAAGWNADPEQLDDAWQLLQEVQDLLNTAVRHDVVVVVPSTPSPPPRLDAPPALLHSWLGRCHAFAALTACGGCPSVVLPVGQLPQGAGPLSVCLFGHNRSDQRLLTVAERLAMHAQAEFRKIEEKRAADTAAADAALDAAADEADRPQQGQQQQGSSSSRRGRQPRQQQQQAEQAVDPRRLAKADKAKTRGNEAFKQGKYRDAIKAYSEAAKLDPSNPVYLSNRALCYLRLFSFEAAEADCNAVLTCPSLSAPDQVKALLRRGTARIHKNELEGAASDFRQVLALEPNNRQAREELKAMQQQQREMQEEQRRAFASRINSSNAAGAAGSGGGGSSNGGSGLTFSLYPQAGMDGAAEGLGAAAGGGGGVFGRDPVAAAAAAAAAGELTPEEFEAMRAMLQSGSLPVVLGDEGQPVLGPRGEPVIVGPGGQRMTVGPSGGMQPYSRQQQQGGGGGGGSSSSGGSARRKRSSS